MGKRLHIITLLCVATLFSSCGILGTLAGSGNYSDQAYPVNASGRVKEQFEVEIAQCVGNVSSQSIIAVVVITNMGPNDRKLVGGSLDGTMAVNNFGHTSKPYSSAGVNW